MFQTDPSATSSMPFGSPRRCAGTDAKVASPVETFFDPSRVDTATTTRRQGPPIVVPGAAGVGRFRGSLVARCPNNVRPVGFIPYVGGARAITENRNGGAKSPDAAAISTMLIKG